MALDTQLHDVDEGSPVLKPGKFVPPPELQI